MQAESVTFALVDTSAGFEATPQRVRLETLSRFSVDVERLLKGASREVDTAALDVAVVSGSLAIRTAPLAAAPSLVRDLQSLLESELLDSLDAKRREVLERWQKLARQTQGLAFRISAPFLARAVIVDAGSDYRADDADQWVQVERYITGEVQDLGGSTRANAHVRLPDGTMLMVTTDRDVLRDDKENRLYKRATLRVRAQYNVLTKQLRDARLVEFVEYAPRFDDVEMARLTRRGAQAWKEVPDAVAWIEDLRGGNE
jgi:hypothetical protein